MITRKTHARIYQGDLSNSEHEELQSLARRKNVSIRDLILNAIGEYFKDWNSRFSLDIEEVLVNNACVRLYLWLPYEIRDEIDQFTKNKGAYIQELVWKAIKYYRQIEPEDITE